MKRWNYRLYAVILAVIVTICGMPVQAMPTEETVSENSLQEEENLSVEFRYEEYFEDTGVKVVLSAEEGVVPKGAYADVEPLLETTVADMASVLQEGVDERLGEKIQKAASDPMHSVYNMYYDLHAEIEKTLAYDFNIYYADENGDIQIFEPKDGEKINVSFVIPGISEAVADDMQEVDLHHVSEKKESKVDDVPSEKGTETKVSVTTPVSEILTDKLNAQGDTLSFDAEHFSVYAITIAKLGATAEPAMVAAQQRAWKLINTYSDPNYYLFDPYRDNMTDAQYAQLKQVALQATAGCQTPYEKMEAITKYVSETIYYDYAYINDKANNAYIDNPYDVYRLKRAVCGGYARYTRTLLISLGIPCMDIYSQSFAHEFNVAYDSVNKRWVYIDSCWNTYNKYKGPQQWEYFGYNGRHFDLLPEEIAACSSHEMFQFDGLKKSDVYYQLTSNGTNWSDMDWIMRIIGTPIGQTTLRAEKDVDGILVKGMAGDTEGYGYKKSTTLEEIDLSAVEITEIPSWTFSNLSALKTIKLPNTLETIGEYALYNCQALQTIDLSNTRVSAIGKKAMYNCNKIKTIKFPDTLETIDEEAFAFCKKIKKVDLSKTKLKTIKKVFFVCSSLKKVILPRNLKSIEKDAFTYCGSLKSITIPTSVKKIDTNAFNAYSMTIYGANKSRAQKYAKKKNYVFKVKAPAKKIALDKKKVTLSKGEKLKLIAKLAPADSIDKIKWSSSNKKVAKVNANGVVTARKRGTAVITAKTSAGKSVKCKVTVKNK